MNHPAADHFSHPTNQGKDPENMLQLAKPDSKMERSKGVVNKLLHWEDGGGPVIATGNPLPQVAEINTPRPMDAVGDDLLYDEL